VVDVFGNLTRGSHAAQGDVLHRSLVKRYLTVRFPRSSSPDLA
jgi:hypothetical protein